MDTVEPKTWAEITSQFDKLTLGFGCEYSFRGQANALWPVASSLEHHRRRDAISEQRMVYAFQASASIYDNRIDARQMSYFEILSMLRHHGAPTFLSDWTTSPMVALYFAAAETQGQDDGAIFAFKDDVFHQAFVPVELEGVTGPIKYARFDRDRQQVTFEGKDGASYGFSYDDLLKKTGINTVIPIASFSHNRRLHVQQGRFFRCLETTTSLQVGLESIEALAKAQRNPSQAYKKPDFVKIIVPNKLKDEILARLFLMNVHRLSLFPDLDGLAAYAVATQVAEHDRRWTGNS